MSIHYIPARQLPEIKDNLQGGEIASIVQTLPGIFSAHMGLIIRDEYGNLLFRHASSRLGAGQVVDEYFDAVAAQLKQSDTRVGMVFLRLRDQPRELPPGGHP